MKKSRLVLLGTGLALAVTLTASQGTVLLRRELKAGAKDVYSMSGKTSMTIAMDQAGMGAMPFDFSYQGKMELAFDRVSTDGKEANITLKFTDMQYDMGQLGQMMGGQAELPKEVSTKGTLDTRNRIRGVQFPQAAAQGMMFFQTVQNFLLFFEFPQDPVRIGDSWDVNIPATPLTGNKSTRLTATLVGEKSVGQGTAWAIKLSGTFNINADMAEMMRQMGGQSGMPAMFLTGKMLAEGEALVEKGTGRTIKFETSYKFDVTTDFPEMSMKAKQTGTSVMTLALVNN